MAIVQISRITVRKGLAEDGPQATDPLRRTQLAGGEFGWCTDTRQLFIGNGTTGEPPAGDGAPVIGNTEVLTEFSDITAAIRYTYEDIVVGYPAQTGPTTSDPVIRTVQARLDDFATVRGFGAVGDGITDDTAAINRALYQLYCVQSNTAVRRTLYFPAGIYRVTDSVIIPSYAKLMGEGKDCSVILFDPFTWTNTITYAAGELVVSNGDFYRARVPVPLGIALNNTTYWQDNVELPSSVAQYGDSLQQVGANIGTNNAVPPRNIEISSMSFQTVQFNNGFFIEQARDSWFDSVGFRGPMTASTISPTGPTTAAVRIEDENFDMVFDKCDFSGYRRGIWAADNTVTSVGVEIQGLTVTNSEFLALFRGIEISGISTGTRVVHNVFDLIYQQGIIFDSELNVSAYNVFYNVGNNLNTAPNPTPQTSVILLEYETNVSVGDMFERSDVQSLTQPRISFGTATSATSTPLQLGRYSRVSGKSSSLANNVSNQVIIAVNPLQVNAFVMDYTITRVLSIRTGRMVVVYGTADDSTPNSAWTDDYSENMPTGITLFADEVSNNIVIKYNSEDLGTTGTIRYSLSYLI
jgi:hypothetical protein